MLRLKRPLDRTPYDRDPRSCLLSTATQDGRYVYVVDAARQIRILPDDGPHLHPKILGNALAAWYAGEVVLMNHAIVELTNCSGTFQFQSQRGLIETARLAERLGLVIAADALIFHYFDRISRPKVLRYRSERDRDDG
jgi:hypothetical protein